MRSDLAQTHIDRNRETEDLTTAYTSHRDRIMQLISSTAADLGDGEDQKCSSIVLLGAGNCLDVDAAAVADLFRTIHLVDLDETAVQSVVNSHPEQMDQFRIHAPADIAEPLLSLTSRDFQPEEENREHCIKVLQALSSENGVSDVPEADVVVSLCVLSQMVGSLSGLIGEDHPTFVNALRAVRVGHLRRMLSLLRPGGVAIFVSDIVSSDTAEQLKTATAEQMPEIVRTLVAEKNFFSGTNPSVVLSELNVLSRLASGPDTVHTIDPWTWHMGNRTYAVYAFRIQKKMQEAVAPAADDAAE
ncbi:MAG: hypothetical protein GY903_26720 [Fuerstiella sp.]|nr:hypothetical protein [Fuerstiella sp.]MCP4858091.1 hypothetical protein [Fuerstiella sp.]